MKYVYAIVLLACGLGSVGRAENICGNCQLRVAYFDKVDGKKHPNADKAAKCFLDGLHSISSMPMQFTPKILPTGEEQPNVYIVGTYEDFAIKKHLDSIDVSLPVRKLARSCENKYAYYSLMLLAGNREQN